MNLLMSGMMPIASLGRIVVGGMASPLTPEFWFIMSMALRVGFVVAYPINWWLVARGLKHGMLTVRDPADTLGTHETAHSAPQSAPISPIEDRAGHTKPSRSEII